MLVIFNVGHHLALLRSQQVSASLTDWMLVDDGLGSQPQSSTGAANTNALSRSARMLQPNSTSLKRSLSTLSAPSSQDIAVSLAPFHHHLLCCPRHSLALVSFLKLPWQDPMLSQHASVLKEFGCSPLLSIIVEHFFCFCSTSRSMFPKAKEFMNIGHAIIANLSVYVCTGTGHAHCRHDLQRCPWHPDGHEHLFGAHGRSCLPVSCSQPQRHNHQTWDRPEVSH